MAIGLFIISCLISVTVVCVTQPSMKKKIYSSPTISQGLVSGCLILCVSAEFPGSGNMKEELFIPWWAGSRDGSWRPGITSEVYLWRPLSPKDILSPNVSRISPHGDEMSSHMSLWGHTSFSNHSKVQSMSIKIGQGELTCSPWPLKTNKSVLLQIFIVGLADLKFLIRHSHSPLMFLGIYQISVPFSF